MLKEIFRRKLTAELDQWLHEGLISAAQRQELLHRYQEPLTQEFIKELQKEAGKWLKEGLISEELWQNLADRYQFDTSNQRQKHSVLSDSPDRSSITVLYTLGAILIGFAVIIFVSAGWQLLNDYAKLGILILWVIGSNVLGFYLWQRTEKYRGLGQGLLLVSGISYGGVLLVTAQTFDITGQPYSLFFAWAIGVLTMGGSLRLLSLSIMGLVLLIFSCLTYLLVRDGNLIGVLMPYIALALFPFAYWLNNPAIFICTMLLWFFSHAGTVSIINSQLVWLLPVIVFWGCEDSLLLNRLGTYLAAQRFQPIARRVSVALLSLCLYIYSFSGAWHTSIGGNITLSDQIYFGVICGISAYIVMHQLWHSQLLVKGMFGIVSIFGVISLVEIDTTMRVVIANLLLALFGGGLIRYGFEQTNRYTFWFGLILLGLQALSKTFEYDLNAVSRSLSLAVSGSLLLGLGLWFERYLEKKAKREDA
ncbi:MAG: DUF2157 domain-containing protein [Pseudanabaenaceae cyanobacterium]